MVDDSGAARKAQDHDQRPLIQNLAQGAGLALQAKLGLQPQWDVLDFGCGTGLVLQRVADNVRAAVGVDPDQSRIDVLRRKNLKNVTACCLELSSTATLQQHYSQQGLAGKGTPDSFDLLYSNMTLHHLQDITATVTMLKGYLKPGGTLVAFDLEKGSNSILFHPQPISSSVYHRGGFTAEDLCSTWQNAGLKDVSCDKVHRFTKEVNHGDDEKPKKIEFWMLMVKGTSV